jgi:hypothetical protein
VSSSNPQLVPRTQRVKRPPRVAANILIWIFAGTIIAVISVRGRA